MFPLFAARFFNRNEDDAQAAHGTSTPPKRGASAHPSAPAARALGCRISSLKALDLQTLPRDDGPPTELRSRKEKLEFYDQQCSCVGGRLYVSGETVAKNKGIMHASRITHVINCVGFVYPAYFSDEFVYQTLYLKDAPSEDILCILYDVFDFIDSCPEGRVLIHCSQGVSRSTSLAIAYRMWAERRGYDDVFAEVKRLRGVANPNIGFICQLLQWQKRRGPEAGGPRLYRLAPQSPEAPQYLVPKLAAAAAPAALDPRGAFVLHAAPSPGVFVWVGAQCPEAYAAAARRAADQLRRYEGAAEAEEAEQGREPPGFWEALGCGEGGAGAPQQVALYDRDYELYLRSLGPARGPPGSCDSARSGRKTPRAAAAAGAAATSPNDRLRKLARLEALERERTGREGGDGEPLRPGSSFGSAPSRHLGEFETDAPRRPETSPAAAQRAGAMPRLAEEAAPQAAPRAARPVVPRLSLAMPPLQRPSPPPPQQPRREGAADEPPRREGEVDERPQPQQEGVLGGQQRRQSERAGLGERSEAPHNAAARRPPPVPRLNLRS